MSGKVYIIGGGPGDISLITLRGLECLKQADVVIYDYLVNPELLEFVRTDANKIYVGKRGGEPSIGQSEINALMIKNARAGKVVARLKGGDPFVFGRAAEELLALAENAIPFEIVLGVSSALAVPAYAGIPITHREISSSVCIVTGHEAEGKEETGVDWNALARTKGTLVILMGVGSLASIAAELVKHGMSPETPLAVIRWGTYPEQETITSNLKEVEHEVEKRGIKPPAVIVIGECVKMRSALTWFETRPLFGKRIAVTSPSEQSGELTEGLRALGARVHFCPTIQIKPIGKTKETDSIIELLGEFDWVVFTSKNSVEIFMKRLYELGKDARIFGSSRIAAIGEKTASKLEHYGLRADIVPIDYSQEGLARWLDVRLGERVLMPRAAGARDFLTNVLTRRGAEVVTLDLYETVADSQGVAKLRELLMEKKVDVVTFTSSSTVEKFVEALNPNERESLFKGVLTASIGSVTSKTLKDCGLAVSIESEVSTFESMVRAIQNFYSDKKT